MDGVRVTMTAGGASIERHLPAVQFALDAGESLDRRVPAAGFAATIDVTLRPGRVKSAHLGAELRGGQLIIRRGDSVLLSEAAGDETIRTMTALPVPLPSRAERVTFEFTRTGDGPAALRGLWQPPESLVPLPLPCTGSPITTDAVVRGLVVAQEANCAACHRSGDAALQASLEVAPGPSLADAGARLRPSWIRQWLTDPGAVKPGTRMPHVLAGMPGMEGAVEDLTHFLASLGGPLAAPADETPADAALVTTGLVAYHTVGCFACHGPLERLEDVPGAAGTSVAAWRTYAPLGAPATKTTRSALAAFLADPLAHRPSGLMPDQKLTDIEASAIAAYLMTKDDVPAEPAFTVDRERALRGAVVFSALGCGACHDAGDAAPNDQEAPPWESMLAASPDAGCRAETPRPGLPRFHLDPAERADLDEFLGASTSAVSVAPIDHVAATLDRLDCLACHAYHGDEGPEPAVAAYFATKGEADLGDEGRLPPDLTDAGVRLTAAWLHEVLEDGGEARPYMAARMPNFGSANVGGVPAGLAAAGGSTPLLDVEPHGTTDDARAGRALVGAKALNCIQCHTIAGNDSTGTPGPDLARMPGRLRHEYFARWLHDPAAVTPGTRMPTFYIAGRSAVVDHYGGEAEAQINAMWRYLSQGESLPLPEGLTDPVGLELVVGEQPIVFRTFMADAGVRAIACGFPEGVHCAFDADRCEMTMAWNGRFLSAAGAWAARGGTETNPDAPAWRATDAPLVDLPSAGEAAPRRFRGYRLDADGAPTFLYELGPASAPVRVEERPVPLVRDDGFGLRRLFVFEGPPGTVVRIGSGDDAGDLTLDEAGRGELDWEVHWP
jgi:mono/diheme cytochrome c family protein